MIIRGLFNKNGFNARVFFVVFGIIFIAETMKRSIAMHILIHGGQGSAFYEQPSPPDQVCFIYDELRVFNFVIFSLLSHTVCHEF